MTLTGSTKAADALSFSALQVSASKTPSAGALAPSEGSSVFTAGALATFGSVTATSMCVLSASAGGEVACVGGLTTVLSASAGGEAAFAVGLATVLSASGGGEAAFAGSVITVLSASAGGEAAFAGSLTTSTGTCVASTALKPSVTRAPAGTSADTGAVSAASAGAINVPRLAPVAFSSSESASARRKRFRGLADCGAVCGVPMTLVAGAAAAGGASTASAAAVASGASAAGGEIAGGANTIDTGAATDAATAGAAASGGLAAGGLVAG